MRLVMQSNALKPFNNHLAALYVAKAKKKMKTTFHFYSYILNNMQTNLLNIRNTFFQQSIT